MHRSEVREAVREERERLATALRTLEPEQWETPSLCPGWRVRDVVGHLLALGVYYRGALAPIVDLARVGFRPNVFVAKDARRRGESLAVEELPGALEGTAFEEGAIVRLHPWPLVPLAEIVVHGQDVRRPLGIPHGVPVEYLQAAGEFLWRRGHVVCNRKKVRDIRFEATDIEWSVGEGPTVRGPLESLIVTLAGRTAALAELHGEGTERFRRRLPPVAAEG